MLLDEDDVRLLVQSGRFAGGSRCYVSCADLQLMSVVGRAWIAGFTDYFIGVGRLSPAPLGQTRRPRIRPMRVQVPKGPDTTTGPEPGIVLISLARCKPEKPVEKLRAIFPCLLLGNLV